MLGEPLSWARASLAQVAQENPLHLAIEVFLIGFIVYIVLVKRAYDPAKRGYGGRGNPPLSEKEQDELIAEWEPEPLVPDGSGSDPDDLSDVVPYVVAAYEGAAAGQPQSLKVKVQGDAAVKTLWTSGDYLGLGGSQAVRDAAQAGLEKFTVGSCGPRGFYGTTTAHLELESAIASFMRAPESITYSDATATVVSVIPAFAKRGDVLLVDAGAGYGVQQGARLSRSKVVWWSHNDTADLKAKLEAVAAADARKKGASALEQRRFIVVEGLYGSSGQACPLAEVVRLAKQYQWRVILDDSLAFGVLGAGGKGSAEHAGLPVDAVDVTVGSLSNTLGSVGGFCVGSREVVDHQRLSGVGYCFSASAPPFLMATATAALRQLEAHPGLAADLRARATALHKRLSAGPIAEHLRLISDPLSPVKHLVLADKRRPNGASAAAAAAAAGPAAARMLSPTTQRLPAPDGEAVRARAREESVLDEIVRRAAAGGVLLCRSHALPSEPFPARPALKITVTLAHSASDEEELMAVLKRVLDEVM